MRYGTPQVRRLRNIWFYPDRSTRHAQTPKKANAILSPARRRARDFAVFLPPDFVTYAIIEDNYISDCGRGDFVYNGDSENGEGLCE